RPGGDDDVFGDQIFVGLTGNLDGPATVNLGAERTLAMEERNLVLLEQVKDSFVVLLDDGILATDEGVKLEAETLDLDTMLGKVFAGLFVMLGRLQQSFGRDAAHVGAGASRSGFAGAGRPGVDAGDRHAKLGGANGGNIASGAGPDYHYVKLFSHLVYSELEEAIVRLRPGRRHA